VATGIDQRQTGSSPSALSNGVRVVLKPTTFKEDEIFVSCGQPGRYVPWRAIATFIPAETADEVIRKAASASCEASTLRQGSRRPERVGEGRYRRYRGRTRGGASSRKDLETMFQLIYLTFTAPRPDPVAFGVFKEQLRVALANQDALPDTAFEDALNSALTQNHPRALGLKAANVDEMNLDRSLAFYKERSCGRERSSRSYLSGASIWRP
jgi:zinc protease